MRFLKALFLSLLIHFTIVWLSQFIPNFDLENKSQPIEIAIVNSTPESSKTGPVIRQLNLPDVLKSKNTLKTKYQIMAEEMVRVKEELQAMRSGVTKNRSQKMAQNPTKKNQKSGKLHTNKDDIFEGMKVNSGAATQNTLSFEELGESAIGMQLPDGIKAGMFTAVNTDRYLYSSYYNRVEELILPDWSHMLDFIIRNPPSALQASIHRSFNGMIEIWSKPSGEIIAVKLLKSFGIDEFDRSLLEAFRRVKMIPNPPKDKIGPDHIARVQMGGYIHVDPKVLGRR